MILALKNHFTNHSNSKRIEKSTPQPESITTQRNDIVGITLRAIFPADKQ